jgi:hypothetical protein
MPIFALEPSAKEVSAEIYPSAVINEISGGLVFTGSSLQENKPRNKAGMKLIRITLYLPGFMM